MAVPYAAKARVAADLVRYQFSTAGEVSTTAVRILKEERLDRFRGEFLSLSTTFAP